jgi:hypothetical protein
MFFAGTSALASSAVSFTVPNHWWTVQPRLWVQTTLACRFLNLEGSLCALGPDFIGVKSASFNFVSK